ncbi:hypothetical protein FAUST_8209 [Fusarium austroamericanum]|uniref:Uncharacterized protein n=1 Tax=Fusarium austroamericanum TaxID=282268 RepID=A0AAN5Z5C7_FUSAU|nr:hypothetical protein FAUST_8209 [Fusarium austroamericanum]
MEPETRATSFEKDAHKTKDNALKGKTRSNSLFTINFPDERYELFLNNLTVEVFVLAQMAFLPGGKTGPIRMSPWLIEYPEEFLKHVELVAHPDARSGKWERLLRNGDERVNLIAAIIFKIFDQKIFSPLLFGAESKHMETLKNSDTELINAEGFERSAVFSHTSRAWLRKNNGMPPLFWQEVDKLCTQTLTMLLPLHEYVKKTAISKPVTTTQLYQSLHDIIAYAGWISVCIRMSPAVVSIDWNIPGEPFSIEPINNAHEAYEASKETAKAHEASMKIARQYQMRAAGPGSSKPPPRQVESAPRVKITVTPKMVRHKPLPKAVRARGVTSYTIMKPSVVFYEGFKLEHDEQKSYMSLPYYIQRLRDRNCVPQNTAMAIMMVAFTWALVSYTTSGQQAWQMLQQWLQSLR